MSDKGIRVMTAAVRAADNRKEEERKLIEEERKLVPADNMAVYLHKTYRFFDVGCSYAIAPEQKARTTYDNLLRMVSDPEVCDPLRFLREREIVHFQRFGEAKRED